MAKSRSSSKGEKKAYMWRINPDKDSRKFSHKKYDGATRGRTKKI